MKLIPMTDFVFQLGKTSTFDTDQIDWYNKELDKLDQIRGYANFLKQPLKLEMFVPCDDDGIVLEVPENYHFYEKRLDPNEFRFNVIDCIEYKEAKEKVLFEGISVQNSKEWIELYGEIRIYVETDVKEKMFSHVFREEYSKHKTIEDLTKYDLTLTENAIKQIGL